MYYVLQCEIVGSNVKLINIQVPSVSLVSKLEGLPESSRDILPVYLLLSTDCHCKSTSLGAGNGGGGDPWICIFKSHHMMLVHRVLESLPHV